jgi:DNA-binding transcriptional regulator GbsR (MarR family)
MDKNEIRMRECIEKFGVFFKKAGHQSLMGRLIGYLMVANPPYKSFEEIMEFLVCSKSAVSNVLNMLMAYGFVDYISFAGNRKRYFKLNHGAWDTYFNSEIRETLVFKGLVREAMELRKQEYGDVNQGLEELYLLLETFEQEFPSIREKWKAKVNLLKAAKMNFTGVKA